MEKFKSAIKFIFPEQIKETLRKIEDFFRRLSYGLSRPIVLTDINDLRFILYPEQKDHIRFLCKRGEQKIEFSAMKKILAPGQIVFDVGANIGVISLFLAKNVTNIGEVHSFEPFPESFRRLKENIALNNFDHISCNEIGLSDKIAETELFYDALHPGFNSLGQMKDNEKNPSVTIQLDTIDNYCRNKKIKHIDVLKIDVEGFELDVLKGARNMLKDKAINFIQFELSDTFLARFGQTPEVTVDYLNSLGYQIFDFGENQNIFLGPLAKLLPGCQNYYSSHRDLTTETFNNSIS